jgi:formylglycine-generating enzyme required for sulfatase activity
MTTDLTRRLHRLRESYADGDIDATAYEAGLARLRGQFGDAAVATLLEAPGDAAAARGHTLVVNDGAQVPVAVAGDVSGGVRVFIAGRRVPASDELLAGYLARLRGRCGELPLRGVREQKSATDVFNIGLDQVYTQLATTRLLTRERFFPQQIHELDPEQFLKQHQGEHLLPLKRREALVVPTRLLDDPVKYAFSGHRGIRNQEELYDLQHISHSELQRICDTVSQSTEQVPISFAGLQLVTETIAASPRLVLLGEPGSGKSTALRYLALTLACAGLDEAFDLAARLDGWESLGAQGRLLPIFLPLLPLAKRFAGSPRRRGTAADLWNELAAHLEPKGAQEGLAAAVHEELEAGRVLLLLDGLDEVAGANSRRQVIETVQAFAAEYHRCRIVVACRVRAYEGAHNAAWQLPGWPTATLADWTQGQMTHFISAWYHAAAAASRMADARRDERIAALQRAVTTRDDLAGLGVRPLLLTIMALVHLNDGRLPEERVALYSRCIDILLAQWEIAGKDETAYGTLMDYIGLPDTDVKTLRPLLSRAAYLAHEAGTPGDLGRLQRAELRELVMQALADRKHPNPYEGAARFLEYTDVRAGLLQASDAGDAYAFPHQTFQEYLAGLELVSGVDFAQRIMARREDDRWRVPIFLGIGHTVSEGVLAAAYQLLSRLLHTAGRQEDRRQRDLVLAAELAADVGWDRLERGGAEFSALRRDLALALVQVVEGRALAAAERVRAGVLLGDLGDLRPGVCILPPAIIELPARRFMIGSTPEEAERAGEAYEQYYLARGDKDTAKRARDLPQDEINDQAVTIAPFAIGRYPVTNAQYALFIAADGYDSAQPWWDDAGRAWLARGDAATEGLERWQRRTRKNRPEYWSNELFGAARPNHPVVGISWYEATAFCRWLTLHLNDGFMYRLPSEAEWEYAARGTGRRTYPWGGEPPDAERANYDQAHQATTAVGCFLAGTTPDGIFDLAGNVWEWTRSVYQPYPYDPVDGRESAAEPDKKRFTLRGGSWLDHPLALRAVYRLLGSPDLFRGSVGFRLARHPPRVKD